jgi:hypothetical protein
MYAVYEHITLVKARNAKKAPHKNIEDPKNINVLEDNPYYRYIIL